MTQEPVADQPEDEATPPTDQPSEASGETPADDEEETEDEAQA